MSKHELRVFEQYKDIQENIESICRKRARAFSKLTVLFAPPEHYIKGKVKIFNPRKMKSHYKEFEQANEELIRLVRKYNRIAASSGYNKIDVVVQ